MPHATDVAAYTALLMSLTVSNSVYSRFFHEDNGQVTSNHNESTKVNAFQQMANLKNNFKENNSANNVKLINRAMRELGETEGDVRR